MPKDPTKERLTRTQARAIADATVLMLLETIIEDAGGNVLDMVEDVYGRLTSENIHLVADALLDVMARGRQAKDTLAEELRVPK